MDQLVLVVERQNVTRLVINGVYHRPGHGDEFAHSEKEKEAHRNECQQDLSSRDSTTDLVNKLYIYIYYIIIWITLNVINK